MKFLWNTSSRISEWCWRTQLQQWCRFWNSREFSSQVIWSARLKWFGMWFGPIKKASQILVSTLNEKNVLEQGVKVSFSWTRESPFLQYFRGDSSFVFCHNIPGLLKEIELSIYSPNEWRMFFGNSKQNLKCVLQRNGNLFGVAPIGHSVCLREENGDVERVIELFQYDNRKWITFADLKMACFLFGQQRGYTNISAFSVSGIAEIESSIWLRPIGLQDLTLNLEIVTFYMSHLLIGRKKYSYLCT